MLAKKYKILTRYIHKTQFVGTEKFETTSEIETETKCQSIAKTNCKYCRIIGPFEYVYVHI